MALTFPDSNPLAQVVRIDAQVQQPPSTSPASAAIRIFEVPLKPSMSCIGKPRAAFKTRGTSESLAPGASPPSFTGFLAANQSSNELMPLALVSAQTVSSCTGAPTHSNLRPSNSMPL